MSILTTATAAILLAAPAIAASPFSAAASGDPSRVEVRHGDLDLTSAHDVVRLHRRIVSAARIVCGTYDVRDIPAARRGHACIDAAIGAATPKAELAVARANRGSSIAANAPEHATTVR